jgi:hypothetical protein
MYKTKTKAENKIKYKSTQEQTTKLGNLEDGLYPICYSAEVFLLCSV